MRMLRRLASAIALAALAMLPAAWPAHALEQGEAEQYVNSVVKDALGKFAGQSLPKEERISRFVSLVDSCTDIDALSAELLGRYWAKAAPDEQQRFQAALKNYMVSTWGVEIDGVPTTATIKVIGSEVAADRVLVNTLAASTPTSDVSQVQWVVQQTAQGRPYILDITVDGVSLTKTMKGDFTSVLRANGGKMDALVEAMKKKTAEKGM